MPLVFQCFFLGPLVRDRVEHRGLEIFTKARAMPDEVKQLLMDAEKLGKWCGQLTLHEVTTTLKVKL